MPRAPRLALERGLYLVTPDDPDRDALLARVQPLLPACACLQYRNKQADAALRRAQATALADACRAAGVPFIVNDDARLAADLGAGVHLGEHDGSLAAARALVGDDAIIGVSCYDTLDRARQAAAAGADYIAFGAFFPSTTKPNARRASLSLLRDAAPLGLPRVAIGGITPDNARPLVDAGADLIAVVSGVFDAPDPLAAARACQALFEIPES
ncbi:thiamine-phosphate synthase [Lysobacter helvus]|uniref:Thiamine-phosphate synthase n=2 Tax=Lysobacteraceae TaxID=32033 RepID=A0ABM7Q5Z2_9GAMM|nr:MULTISPECIES: thiamine phosphate synthase [Lysobacter]BCT92676.1 thiamine-phosphate synthase [Lysobacter caseinilyticus]BCT95829.1 thiamine-phosphate synthase [Lysobacter helvus]